MSARQLAPAPSKREVLNAFLVLLALAMTGCGPGDPAPDCVSVDERLGVPGDRQWCEGEFYPSIEWQGELADKALPVCLPPQADGTCELCPTDKVTADVENKLLEYLAEYRPMCKPDHWELGCMRTIENAISLGREPDYCCFEVALWGQGCADQP